MKQTQVQDRGDTGRQGKAIHQRGSGPRTDYVVGIGASAGGLEALEDFFENVSEDSAMAYLVIQHRSPDFKSMMDELLARRTRLPIHRVEDGMRVEAGHVYLLPPKGEIVVSDGRWRLTDKDPQQRLSLPIDHLQESLAEECGERAIALILSGTGSGGSRGVRVVHDASSSSNCRSLPNRLSTK